MNSSVMIGATLIACGLMSATLATAHGPATQPAESSAGGTPSSSLMKRVVEAPLVSDDPKEEPHALRAVSMFGVKPVEKRTIQEHDLVQIIVRETSTAKSSQDLETKKESDVNGKVTGWPDFGLSDLLELQIRAGRTTDLPKVGVEFTKEFTGEGDYARKDDFSARITAEVIEVLPNGNLVLEARTSITTDKEEQHMKVTGICRQEDVTDANTVLSNQIHDLVIAKMHKGELKDAGEKGIIAKVLETVFAF